MLASAVVAVAFGAVSAPAFADNAASGVSVSANVGLVTDYRFRGISQNLAGTPASNQPEAALQGGFDVDFGNGFYVGNWNSNVNFSGSTLEMDLYGGYSGEYNGLSYDVGALYYYYPGANTAGGNIDPDTLELYGSLGFYGFTLGLSYNTSNDLFGVANNDGATYTHLDYEYPLSEAIGLVAHYGTTQYEDGTSTDYDDYSLGVTYAAHGFDFGLTYVDTDIDGAAKNDTNDGTVVFSVSKSF